MTQGVWIGNDAIPHGILILGESHYDDEADAGKPVPYTTADVVSNYLNGPSTKWGRFFTRIAESFGYDYNSRKDFYDKVYFGNYIDKLCGKRGDSTASKIAAEYRTEYNDQLFSFVNEHGIYYVLCFSKLVYWNLPGTGTDGHFEELSVGKIRYGKGWQNNKVGMGQYKKDVTYPNTSIPLNHDVMVYGIRHPSTQNGYDAAQIYHFLTSQPGLKEILR